LRHKQKQQSASEFVQQHTDVRALNALENKKQKKEWISDESSIVKRKKESTDL